MVKLLDMSLAHDHGVETCLYTMTMVWRDSLHRGQGVEICFYIMVTGVETCLHYGHDVETYLCHGHTLEKSSYMVRDIQSPLDLKKKKKHMTAHVFFIIPKKQCNK